MGVLSSMHYVLCRCQVTMHRDRCSDNNFALIPPSVAREMQPSGEVRLPELTPIPLFSFCIISFSCLTTG